MHEISFTQPIEARPAGGPVTCLTCGCRLTPATDFEGSWRHFQIRPGQDARGCRPACLEELHRADGTVFRPATLEQLMAAPRLP